MNSNWAKILLKIFRVKYGKLLTLHGVPFIFNHKGASLRIGNNVTINSSFLSNLCGLYSRSIIVTRWRDANIDIGDNVGLSGVTIYARKSVKIGDNTLIGANTKILDNDFHPIEVEKRIELLKNNRGGGQRYDSFKRNSYWQKLFYWMQLHYFKRDCFGRWMCSWCWFSSFWLF